MVIFYFKRTRKHLGITSERSRMVTTIFHMPSPNLRLALRTPGHDHQPEPRTRYPHTRPYDQSSSASIIFDQILPRSSDDSNHHLLLVCSLWLPRSVRPWAGRTGGGRTVAWWPPFPPKALGKKGRLPVILQTNSKLNIRARILNVLPQDIDMNCWFFSRFGIKRS